LLHSVVPLGFQNSDVGRANDVALILFRALDYNNVQSLFSQAPPGRANHATVQESLLLLELLMLVFEYWTASYLRNEPYLLGIVVSLLEIFIHSKSFWNRLRQSALLAKMLLNVQDHEPHGMLRDKAVAVITALSKTDHSTIPSPVDASRFR
jgi:hypothetical protein